MANTQNTFNCLQGVSSATLLRALFSAGILGSTTSFSPVIDGPGGFLPDVPSRVPSKSGLPTITGTNLDEGKKLEITSFQLQMFKVIIGALFTPQNINSTEEISESLIIGSTPSLRSPEALAAAVNKILQLYPDIPALGSPFGTGNNTFGLSSQYKRFASICLLSQFSCLLSNQLFPQLVISYSSLRDELSRPTLSMLETKFSYTTLLILMQLCHPG